MIKFIKALLAHPLRMKIEYKDAIKENESIDLSEIKLDIGIFWILLLLYTLFI